METCDLCGKDLGEKPETIRLYEAHLLGRELKSEGVELYTAPKFASNYARKIKPILVQVCGRHRGDLLKQQAITGLFVFTLIFLPVLFVIGKLTGLFGLLIFYPVIATFPVSIGLAVLIVRTIRYDSLIAVRMTTKAKVEKTDLEYFTEKKYRRILGKEKRAHKPAV